MELKSAPNPIDQAGALKQVASNLFYGWGYNFYRDENKLRADDLMVRGKVSDLLGDARAHIAELEAVYRREHLPPPTREHPVPDAAALATVRQAGEVVRTLEALETRIRNAAVPEMDRINQRHRIERDTLQQLVAADGELVEAVTGLRDATLAIANLVGLHDAALAPAEQRVAAAWSARQAVVDPIVMAGR